jgi:hypothetical protein
MTFKPALNNINNDLSESMCSENGCQNLWTIDNGSKLCKFHAWSDIQTLSESENQNNLKFTKNHQKFGARSSSRIPDEIRMSLDDLKTTCKTPKDPRQWAYSLKHREELGEPLTRLQKIMWRSVLKVEL